jgi:DNA helicase-2/ATP-dependent DNA helicase PcrA
MKNSRELSENQKKIVFSENIPVCVKASAGSGKTRVLTERVRYLLDQTNKKILALTFTNRAGEEIRDRLSDIPDLDSRAVIGTFHGFCQSILENHGSLVGYPIMPHIFEDDSDRLELIEQAINQTPSYDAEFSNKSAKDKTNFRYKALQFISKVKRSLIDDDDICQYTENENLILLYQNYKEILGSQNAIDFDDLLLIAYKLFLRYPKIGSLYRRSFFAICVDEAQDLNNAQYQFIKLLAGDELKNIMLVGDLNQSIYHFNGSSPAYMDIHFVNDFEPFVVELTENYRSSIAVLNAAKSIIPSVKYIEGTVKEGFFNIYQHNDTEAEANWVAEEIGSLISNGRYEDIEGDVTAEKIAVLARNRYLFKSIEEAFLKKNIPFYYKMTPGALKFESQLMNVFDLAFRVKLNSEDTLHFKRMIKLLDVEYVKRFSLEELSLLLPESPEKQIIDLSASLAEDGSNLKKLFEGIKSSVFFSDEDERSMFYNDVDDLLKHWINYAKNTDKKSLHKFKNDMALGKTHPLSQHSGVTLSTVHTMKGQEFDIVFLIGMDDETFPDFRAVKSGGIEMIQEKNNLYVAFTRAKRFLYVSWPQNRLMPWGDNKRRRISRFIKDLQP